LIEVTPKAIRLRKRDLNVGAQYSWVCQWRLRRKKNVAK
jgi:hypothetical protein